MKKWGPCSLDTAWTGQPRAPLLKMTTVKGTFS